MDDDSQAGSDNSIQWLIKTSSEKQLGPYSTETVLKLIADGTFTGSETIKRYPDGRWNQISKQPDFYDKLLEVLEEAAKPKHRQRRPDKNRPPADDLTIPPTRVQQDDTNENVLKKAQQKLAELNAEEETSGPDIDDRTPDFSKQELEKTEIINFEEGILKKKSGSPLKTKPTFTSPMTGAPAMGLPPNKPSTIDLQKVGDIKRREGNKSTFLPVALIGIAILLGVVALFWPTEENSSDEKPNLLSPRMTSSATISGEQVKSGTQKAVASFIRDTFESYSDAQEKLVSVVEGAPQVVEARGMLCLVYKELWPYVKQDTKDYDTIYAVAKSTRSLDPIGINGIYCEIVKLMIQGKYKEARGVVEHSLNQPLLSTAPVLYALKAELLAEEVDYKSAILYVEKARQLWPEWLKPQFDQAIYLGKNNEASKALQNYKQILAKNPKHKSASVEMGLLQYKVFRQNEQAYSILTASLNEKMRIPRPLESEAYHALALISLEGRDSKKAKAFAEKAFKLNPGDARVKVLVAKLGGSTKFSAKSGQNNELVFLGDQYFRTGNCLAAQAEYKTAFEMDPKNAIAALKAAKCLWQLNQAQEAISWLNKAIKADSKLAQAYVLQADYFSDRYDYYSATQILNKASKLFSNNHEVLRGYGLVELRRNNAKDALSYLQRANKIYENDVETMILLAKTYGANGDFSSAQKFAVRAIEIDATSNEAQIVYAQILSQFQGFETGVLYIKDLINKFSYTIEFRMALADMYKEHERYRQSQQIYEQLLEVEPRNKKALLGLGESYQGQLMFDKAMKSFLSAAVLDPSDVSGLFRAGLLYMEMGKNSEAITQFKRALSVNKMYPRLNYFIGKAAFQSGNYELALSAAMEERKLNPNLADSYELAAEVYTAQKLFQKCAEEYQQAVRLRPQGAEIYVKLARCYRQGGSPDIAASMLNIAASQESGLPEIYREQGAIFEQKGDERAAVQAYNKYLALSPNAPDRQEIERKILSIGSGN